MYASDLNSFGKAGKALAFGGKPERNDATLSPGPGAYNGVKGGTT